MGQFAHRRPVGALYRWNHAVAYARCPRGLSHRAAVCVKFSGV
jgi:hypothetical protein